MKQTKAQTNKLQSELKNPILDIAASFWDDARYRAFRVCYHSMRQLDDIVDDLKVAGLAANPAIRAEAKGQLAEIINLLQNNEPAPDEIAELRETMKRFEIPMAPWLKLSRSMEFDLDNYSFDSFLQFVRYAKGAAVAPASIFIHLIGLSFEDGKYIPAPIDIFQSARPLAMFSYLTHIMRDFRQDTEEGLEYFPADIKKRFDITEDDRSISASGKQTDNFTSMVKLYHSYAGWYREKSTVENNPIYAHLDPSSAFSLHLIWELYSQIHEAISDSDYVLDPEKIHPNKDEIYQRVITLARKLKLDDEILERGCKRIGFIEA